MFERHRFCKNPDCMKSFDPTSPLAQFCRKGCANRYTYLHRLAIKHLGKGASKKMILCYIIVKCLYDKRMLRPKILHLKKMGIDFSVLPAAIPYTIGDAKSVYPVGNFGLGIIDNETAFIVNRTN